MLIAAFVRPHPRRVPAHPDEPAGPARRSTSRQRDYVGRELRVAHDAVDRASSSASSSSSTSLDLTWGPRQPALRARRPVRQHLLQLRPGAGRDRLHRRQHRARRSTSSTAPGACSRASGSTTRGATSGGATSPIGFAGRHRRRQRQHARCSITTGAVTDDATMIGDPPRRQDPRGPDRGEVGPAQVRHEAGEPGQQAPASRSSWSAAAWPARPPPRRSASSATTSSCFTFHDSPRRAHSIAAQGGINAAKNYQNDGDSVYRLFYDTVKGGDFRSREANVYRLAECQRRTSSTSASRRACRSPASTAACSTTAPSAAPRCRARSTPAARPASSCCSAPTRRSRARSHLGTVELYTRTEMLDLVREGRRAPSASSPATSSPARCSRTSAHAVRARAPAATATSSTCRPTPRRCNVTADLAGAQARRAVRQPLLHPDPPDLHPGQRRLPVEAHADVASRCATTAASGCPKQLDDTRSPDQIPEAERDYFLERRYPAFGNLVPRDVASRAAKTRGRRRPRRRAAEERRVPRLRRGDRAPRPGRRSRSATATSSRCTSASPARTRTRSPMRIYPAVHYTMGGLWVDYNLMSNDARAVRARRGELLRPRRQPPRRQRADAGPRRRLLRAPVHDRRLPRRRCSAPQPVADRRPGVQGRPRPRSRDQTKRLLSIKGTPLGRPLPPRARQHHVGQLRHGPQRGRRSRRRSPRSPRCARSSGRDVQVLGERRDAQPVAREGRPGRRLPRVRRAAVPRRPRTARSRAAATSASSTRPRRARRCATTSTSPTSPRGSTRASAARRRCTRSRSSSSTSTSPSAATSSRRIERARRR